MTLCVLPEGLSTASAAIEALTARLAAAHAGAVPLADAGAGYAAGDAAAVSSSLPAGL
jgi:hypothetical protein